MLFSQQFHECRQCPRQEVQESRPLLSYGTGLGVNLLCNHIRVEVVLMNQKIIW